MKLLTSRPSFMLCQLTPKQVSLGPRRRDITKAELDLANWMKKNHDTYDERRDGGLPRVTATLGGLIHDLEVPCRERWMFFTPPSKSRIISEIGYRVFNGSGIHQSRKKRVLWKGYMVISSWILKAQLTIPDGAYDTCLLDFDELEFICPTY